MPDNKAIAIITFESKSHSTNVFDKLHDYTIQGTPLYLEWAPKNIFAEIDSSLKKRDFEDFEKKEERKDSGIIQENQSSVYIKNLNFETTAEDIEDLIHSQKLPKVKVVKVISKNSKSLGFGFIDCHSQEEAESLIKKLQGHLLQNHMIKLSLSKAKKQVSNIDGLNRQTKENDKKEKIKIKENSKLMIRNIAFQSNEKELRELIKNIAEIKSLRCPRKVNGEMRGFGFADFNDINSAKKVLAFLGNVHFYGRKLVVEYAKEKQESKW